MSYLRVIPRDLFNEANLLKCIGKLCIETENFSRASFNDDSFYSFNVIQNEDDGSISLENVEFYIDGDFCNLKVHLNSRDAWPLYLTNSEGEELRVFDEQGNLSEEMRFLLI